MMSNMMIKARSEKREHSRWRVVSQLCVANAFLPQRTLRAAEELGYVLCVPPRTLRSIPLGCRGQHHTIKTLPAGE